MIKPRDQASAGQLQGLSDLCSNVIMSVVYSIKRYLSTVLFISGKIFVIQVAVQCYFFNNCVGTQSVAKADEITHSM